MTMRREERKAPDGESSAQLTGMRAQPANHGSPAAPHSTAGRSAMPPHTERLVEAIERYLQAMAAASRPYRPRTITMYGRIFARFAQWHAVYRPERALRDVNREDAAEYRAFLHHPPRAWFEHEGPATDLPGGRLAYRPFSKPLGASRVAMYFKITSFLFDLLPEEERPPQNPFRQTGPWLKATPPSAVRVRHFDRHVMRALMRAAERLEQLARDEDCRQKLAVAVRQRWAAVALYLSGLRLEEFAKTTCSMLRAELDELWLDLPATVAQNGVEKSIPLPADFADELARYYRFHDLWFAASNQDEGRPIMLSLHGRTGVGERQIYNCIIRLFLDAADLLEAKSDSECAAILRSATPEWLRRSRCIHIRECETRRFLASLTTPEADVKACDNHEIDKGTFEIRALKRKLAQMLYGPM